MSTNIQEVERRLLSETSGPCVSLFLPMVKSWPFSKKNPLTLKTLIKKARKSLSGLNISVEEQNNILKPAIEYIERLKKSPAEAKGVIFYLGPNTREIVPVPLYLKPSFHVGQQFDIKPLLRLHNDGHFFLLRIDMNNVNFMRVDMNRTTPIRIPDAPSSFTDFTKHNEFKKVRQHHNVKSGSSNTSVNHGQGGKKKYVEIQQREYCKTVESVVTKYMKTTSEHLVVCGPIELVSKYNEVNHYPNMSTWFANYSKPGELRKIIDDLREKLHTHWGIRAASYISKENTLTVKDRLTDLVELERLAHEGRIRRLFVNTSKYVWGKYNPENHKVALHLRRKPDSQDLLNDSAVHAMRHGAQVDPLPEQMQEGDIKALAVPF